MTNILAWTFIIIINISFRVMFFPVFIIIFGLEYLVTKLPKKLPILNYNINWRIISWLKKLDYMMDANNKIINKIISDKMDKMGLF